MSSRTISVLAATVVLAACNTFAFDPEAKAEQILTEIEAQLYAPNCQLQKFKLFSETHICATHNLMPREARAKVDSVMRWSRAQPKTEWKPLDEGYTRHYGYGYGSSGDFSVAFTSSTMLITYHELPDAWAEQAVEALPEEEWRIQ